MTHNITPTKAYTLILYAFCVFMVGLISHTVQADSVNITATVSGLCGNGVIHAGEQCDGMELASSTCQSLGFLSGVLTCNANCSFDISACNVIVQPPATTTSSSGSSGGSGYQGGGSTGGIPTVSNTPYAYVMFTGLSYPLGKVYILKDGQLVVTTTAIRNGQFHAIVGGLTTGNYTFTIYVENAKGQLSEPRVFPVYVTSGATKKIEGVRIQQNTSVYIPPSTTQKFKIGDANKDNRVNLVDFSILLYWYERSVPPGIYDLNKDGIIDLVDFSILTYNWTG